MTTIKRRIYDSHDVYGLTLYLFLVLPRLFTDFLLCAGIPYSAGCQGTRRAGSLSRGLYIPAVEAEEGEIDEQRPRQRDGGEGGGAL